MLSARVPQEDISTRAQEFDHNSSELRFSARGKKRGYMYSSTPGIFHFPEPSRVKQQKQRPFNVYIFTDMSLPEKLLGTLSLLTYITRWK